VPIKVRFAEQEAAVTKVALSDIIPYIAETAQYFARTQFFLYLIVGGLSFFVDIGAFILLRVIEVPVIPASVTSFGLGTAANYLLSVLLAFERGRFRRSTEMLRFLSVVLIGLGLNTVLVWCFVYRFSIHPTAAKIAVVPIVLIWNYLGRRLFVFSNNIPVAVRTYLAETGRQGP
jgi:putative flippase GtrA